MKRFRLCLVILAALPFLIVDSPLHAEKKKTFIVGIENFKEFMPYSSIRETGKQFRRDYYKGFNRELLDMFAKSKNYSFIYKPYSIKRLYIHLFNGNIDFKFPDNDKWSANNKKGKNIVYSAPVVTYIDGVMLLPNNKGKEISQFNTLGVIQGFSPVAYLDQIEAGEIKALYNNKYETLFQHALNRNLDGVYMNITAGKYYLRDLLGDSDALVFDPSLPHEKGYFRLSTTNYPKVIEEFNQFLKSHRVDIERLKRRHEVDTVAKTIQIKSEPK